MSHGKELLEEYLNQCKYHAHPTDQELRRIMNEYESKDWPGCAGCIDCFHVMWTSCPSVLKPQFAGRYDYANVNVEIVADSNRNTWSVTAANPGTHNDKTVLNFSPFFDKVLKRVLPTTSLEHDIADEHFDIPYWLGNGIYPTWGIFAISHKEESESISHDATIRQYNRKQESRRKDVECAIGMLRKKWASLAYALYTRDVQQVVQVIQAAVALYNMVICHKISHRDPFDDPDEEGGPSEYSESDVNFEEEAFSLNYAAPRVDKEQLSYNEHRRRLRALRCPHSKQQT